MGNPGRKQCRRGGCELRSSAEISWDALSAGAGVERESLELGFVEFHLLDSYGDGMVPGSPDGIDTFYPTAFAYSYNGTDQVSTILSVDTERGDSYTTSQWFEVLR